MAGGGGNKLLFVQKQHLAGIVAHNIVAPACQFELLGVVGKGKSCHRGADHGAELGVGNDVHPRHWRIGVGDNIVAPVAVKSSVLVVVVKVTPYAELFFRLQNGVFNLVLILLVGCFEFGKLLLYAHSTLGVELESGDGLQQDAFVLADFIAVEHKDFAGIAVSCPQMLGVGNVANEMRKTFSF